MTETKYIKLFEMMGLYQIPEHQWFDFFSKVRRVGDVLYFGGYYVRDERPQAENAEEMAEREQENGLLRAENAELRAALEFYAEIDNYVERPGGFSPMDDDAGMRAQDALGL